MSIYDAITKKQENQLKRLGYKKDMPRTWGEAEALLRFLSKDLPPLAPTKWQLEQLKQFNHEGEVKDRNEADQLLARYNEQHNQKMADNAKATYMKLFC
jgi:hypothetical protein